MHDTFDRFEYIDYLRKRWRVVATAAGVALVLSLASSLLLTKRYTATSTIVIEPPGGSDVRAATAVSPVYLESLKTYERFASSDTLFARAAERFHLLRDGSAQSIESLKQGVLKVSKLRDTKILEISVTLPEPKLAQSVVQYLAEETVTMSHNESLAADHDSTDEAQRQVADAQQRLAKAQRAWTAYGAGPSIEALQADIDASVELQTKVRQQLVEAQSDVADLQERQKQPDGEFAQQQLPGARARVALLEKQSETLAREIEAKGAVVSPRTAERDDLQVELKLAQAGLEGAASRLRDLRMTTGTRGERLRVIDPGIVPQRPTQPNIPLNVLAAVFLALVAAIVYLSVSFGYRRNTIGFEPMLSRSKRS